MLVNINYAIGDEVSFKYIQRSVGYDTCPCCSGAGWIAGNDGKEYICPKCDGEKITRVFEDTEGTGHDKIDNICVIWDGCNKPEVKYRMHRRGWEYEWIDQDDIEMIDENIPME